MGAKGSVSGYVAFLEKGSVGALERVAFLLQPRPDATPRSLANSTAEPLRNF